MAVTYFPFNSIVVDGVPDRPANAENLAAYLAGFFSNGVLMQEDTALKVEASEEMLVQIHAGMGVINGKSIRNDSAHILALDNASASLDRIDRIIIRLDETARYMMFDVLKGTPASNPVPPALTQAADIYELCLAEIRVPAGASEILASYITDTRADAELCGVANIPAHMQDLEHGGTGISAETKEALLLALGGISEELLWQNASPTSSFAKQAISLDASTYKSAKILFKWRNDLTLYGIIEIEKNMGKGDLSLVAHSSGYYPHFSNRDVTMNESGIVFGEGHQHQGTSYAVANEYAIPVAIYGVKGVQ